MKYFISTLGFLWCSSSLGVSVRHATVRIRLPLNMITISRPTSQAISIQELPSLLSQSEKVWEKLSSMGQNLSKTSSLSLFFKGVVAGSYVGIGGILSASIGSDMGGSPWIPGNGLRRLLCGAFGLPFSNMLMSFTGAAAWTGDLFTGVTAVKEKKITLHQLSRIALFSFLGCYVGTLLLAFMATGAGLPALTPCLNSARHKYAWTATQTILRGIVGSSLVCSAIYMTKASDSFVGKVLGIWFAIIAQVTCDFEHVLASMFILATAALNGHPFSFKKYIRFLASSVLGNFIGICLMGLGYLGSVNSRIQPTIETVPSSTTSST